mgnify:FL=1
MFKGKYYNKMESNKSKGLGDSIEKFTKATGIKKLADKIPGGCGCSKRKDKLNQMFPYGKK